MSDDITPEGGEDQIDEKIVYLFGDEENPGVMNQPEEAPEPAVDPLDSELAQEVRKVAEAAQALVEASRAA